MQTYTLPQAGPPFRRPSVETTGLTSLGQWGFLRVRFYRNPAAFCSQSQSFIKCPEGGGSALSQDQVLCIVGTNLRSDGKLKTLFGQNIIFIQTKILQRVERLSCER